ncbi:MAG: hypothetical protein WB760_19430 [Xanthobacteraceae bacterium]
MISKPKLALIAAIALAGIASPALAQTSTMHNGWTAHQQERSFRSGRIYNYAPVDPGSNFYDGNQGNPNGSYYPGDY